MPTVSQFRHQHVSTLPSGYRVRTFHAGKHQILVAFPLGTRKRGFGQVISILHPKLEKNPMCGGHLKFVEAEISRLQIPLEVTGNGFGPGFEKALVETDRKNPMDVQEYWEKFKAKVSELIESAKDHDHGADGNPALDAAEITDRAKRYRAQNAIPKQPKKCFLCGSRKSIDVAHKDGDEANNTPSNLRYLCRSCNVAEGRKHIEKGIGVRTNQYNPGAETLGQYVAAAVEHKRGEHDAAGQVLHATPKTKRDQFAKQIWAIRRKHGNPERVRNYTEQIKTSEGKTVFINVDESSKGWRAEGYPIIGGRIKHVGKPKVAYGDNEADAYDALVMKLEKNPRRKAKKNLDEIDEAAALAAKFKGSRAEGVRELSVSLEKHRDDFAHLAWLYELVFHPAYDRVRLVPKEVAEVFHDIYENDRSVKNSTEAWQKTAKHFNAVFLVFDFSGDEIELVSTAKGEQLEFIGGNQSSFAHHLPVFKVKEKHDRDDLGDLVGITYLAKKEQFGDTKQKPYYHVFGEDGGSFPRSFFDELNKRIVITGGSYRLNQAELGIIN